MRKEGAFRIAAKRSIDGSIHVARSLAVPHEGALLAYERLVEHVRSQSVLLPASRRANDGHCDVNAALFALALHHKDWLRPPETWWATTGSVWPQFTSLAHHLFARYHVPNFMTSAWFDMESWKG